MLSRQEVVVPTPSCVPPAPLAPDDHRRAHISKLGLRWYHKPLNAFLCHLSSARKGMRTVTLEDRFRSFASEQKAQADQRQDPYESDVESMKEVDSIVSRVLEAFCHATGWGLKRSDYCDRDKGAVSCNYILEHLDFWREGYVTVDVEVTRGYRSDPVDAVTLYQGRIVGTTEHARDSASRVVIPFGEVSEERLATALEQQSGDLVTGRACERAASHIVHSRATRLERAQAINGHGLQGSPVSTDGSPGTTQNHHVFHISLPLLF